MSSQDEPAERESEEVVETWTYGKGLFKGTLAAVCLAVVLSSAACVVTYYAPYVCMQWLVNGFWGFVVAWSLFAAMHRAAGMVGFWPTVIVVVLAVIVIAARHFVLAKYGVTLSSGRVLKGAIWIDPAAILFNNLFAWGGIVAAVVFCRNGSSVWQDFVNLLRLNPMSGN